MKLQLKIIKTWLIDQLLLMRLAMRLQLGRRFWLVPALALAWPAFQSFRLLVGTGVQGFNETDAQNVLIGLPLFVLAIGMGVRVIAGEIEQRTLEVTYTVPGGSSRVWIAKLLAVLAPLVLAEVILAIITVVFFTAFPLVALYGVLQGTVFYLTLAMALGALFRSEIAAALATAVILALNGMAAGIGRLSPLFNPLAVQNTDATEIFAWTIQNRIGYALAIIALVTLACARTERRERLLGN